MANNYECKNCRYVPKSEFKEYKKDMEKVISKVRKNLKEKYGSGCNAMLAGSAKRNLIVQKGDSLYDVDYQFVFAASKYSDEEKDGPCNLKLFVKKQFESHLGDKYSIKMSKSVITIVLKEDKGQHAIKSFDIALIRENDHKILRGKTNDCKSNDYVRWETLPNDSELYKRRKEIKGDEMWCTLRDIFIKKKCENMNKDKDEQKPTYSLYLESIKETLD